MTIIPKPENSHFNDRQWQAIHTTGSNILVSASAGSGKTTVLIERIYQHLIQERANIDELLVVTFTELAAQEMKDRMEKRLKEAITQSSGPERQSLSDQLRKLPQSHIQTLHSFCLSVIQDYFYLINIDPSFSLLTDETQKMLLQEEAWDKMVTYIVEHSSIDSKDLNRYLDLLSRFSSARNDQGLFQLVLNLHEFASSHPEPDHWLKSMGEYSKDLSKFATSPLYEKTFYPWIEQAAKTAIFAVEQAVEFCRNPRMLSYLDIT